MTFAYDIPVKKFDEVLKSSSISSKHFSIDQFKKNYDNPKLNWCMLFDDNKRCVAAACVEEGFGPTSNSTYINELQCLVTNHGYGKKMLQLLKKHFVFIWLMADPSVKSDALLKFYRDPDLKLVEDVLPANESIYDVDTHFFSVCGRMPDFLRKNFFKSHFGKSDAIKLDNAQKNQQQNESTHILNEGKHWPEDYIKTAVNLIKQSKIGQQPWYTDSFINQDVKTFINEFVPLSHKSSNLGFFMAIVRWFIEYSGDSKQKYQDFIERKLDTIIKILLKIRADKSYDSQAEAIKKMSFSQFEKLMDEVNAKASSEKIQTAKSGKTYKVIPIYSYSKLHKDYGGHVTGYKGESEWCHTNGKSTYDSWTKNGTQMFFVIEQDGWKKIKPPDPKALDSAYDEYGMSLIAILVDVASTKLLNSTLRWNHVILPKSGAPDTAFESWKQLDDAIGIDVKKACEDEMKSLKQKLQAQSDRANAKVVEILKNANTIKENTMPNSIKAYLTKVDIPKNVTSIGRSAFSYCTGMTSVTIPDSVTSIGQEAFYGCSSLTSVTIPDSVTSIGSVAFGNTPFYNNQPNGLIVFGKVAYKMKGSCPASVIIPDNVTSIGWYAFLDCSSLTSVTIPNSVTSIGDDAFYGCSGLTSVTIPNSVRRIGWYAFEECSRLTSVMIPNSVTSLGYQVFYGCTNLKDITFKGKTLGEVKAMKNYPWGIEDKSVIKAEK